ncbi:MAG: hypothetical protein EOP24_26270 [Hyphomicrobiales bacterium]|nr:MAG: hypothetical protein EOP24_26270 [Hyphomicrobiales bacterium]
MLLITMHEWFGPSKARTSRAGPRMEVERRHRGFITSLSLGEAIERIRAYEEAFNARYSEHTALNFELLSASKVDELTEEQIDSARVVHVEKLDESLDGMNDRLR